MALAELLVQRRAADEHDVVVADALLDSESITTFM
jgi:hypothetical protein